jgi:hypothetical protein
MRRKLPAEQIATPTRALMMKTFLIANASVEVR